MSEEILNLRYHKKLLVIKALNRYSTMKAAAAALEITERNLYQLKKEYNVQHIDGKFKIATHGNSKKNSMGN